MLATISNILIMTIVKIVDYFLRKKTLYSKD